MRTDCDVNRPADECNSRIGRILRPGGSVLAALLVLTAAAAQNPTFRLQLSDQVGQTTRYRLTFDIQMRADYSSPEQLNPGTRELMETLAAGMGVRTAVEYGQQLIAVAGDGTREFEVRWYDFDYIGEIGGRPIAPPPAHLQSKRELLARTARVRTTPEGRTLSVVYSDSISAGIARSFERLESAMPILLPEVPVAVGDRWQGTAQIPVSLSPLGAEYMSLALEHRLKEVREAAMGPIAIIEVQGKHSQLQAIEESGSAGPMHVEADLRGTALFDMRGGRFVGGDYEIDMFAVRAEGGIEIQLTGHANGSLSLLRPR